MKHDRNGTDDRARNRYDLDIAFGVNGMIRLCYLVYCSILYYRLCIIEWIEREYLNLCILEYTQ